MTIYNDSLNAARDRVDEAREHLRAAQFAPEARLPLAILNNVAATEASVFDDADFNDLWSRLERNYAPRQMAALAAHLAYVGRTSETVAANALALHAVVLGLADLPHQVARECLVVLKPALRTVGISDGV